MPFHCSDELFLSENIIHSIFVFDNKIYKHYPVMCHFSSCLHLQFPINVFILLGIELTKREFYSHHHDPVIESTMPRLSTPSYKNMLSRGASRPEAAWKRDKNIQSYPLYSVYWRIVFISSTTCSNPTGKLLSRIESDMWITIADTIRC